MKTLRDILIFIGLLGLGLLIYFLIGLEEGARSFSHSGSSDDYDKIKNSISFKTHFSSEKLNNALDSVLVNNPQYRLPYSINESALDSIGCIGDSQQYKQVIYFNKQPKELYFITFDYDYMPDDEGIIDIIFSYKNNQWICTKSSTLDSMEQARILNRFDTAILRKLK